MFNFCHINTVNFLRVRMVFSENFSFTKVQTLTFSSPIEKSWQTPKQKRSDSFKISSRMNKLSHVYLFLLAQGGFGDEEKQSSSRSDFKRQSTRSSDGAGTSARRYKYIDTLCCSELFTRLSRNCFCRVESKRNQVPVKRS